MAAQVIKGQIGIQAGFSSHADFPRNQGTIPNPSAWARGVGVCGDSVEVSIVVEDSTIRDIKCAPNGCRHTVACASAMTEYAKGKTLDQALELTPEDVECELEGLPEDHKHCARLVINTLGEAIEDYYCRLKKTAP